MLPRMSFIYVASAFAVCAVSSVLLTATSQNNKADVANQQRHAFREGGLERAASVTGSYRGTTTHDERGTPSSLNALAATAESIVVGVITSNVCHLTDDGASIFTAYEVQVERVLKGPGLDRLSLVIPGGRVAFPGNRWAQLDIPEFHRPENDQRYVLFLRDARGRRQPGPRSTDTPQMIPTFGGLGVYWLRTDGKAVYPAGSLRTGAGRSIVSERLMPLEFIERVAALVRP